MNIAQELFVRMGWKIFTVWIIVMIVYAVMIYIAFKPKKKKTIKCDCDSVDIECYENNGREYICNKCRRQWLISEDGNIIEL